MTEIGRDAGEAGADSAVRLQLVALIATTSVTATPNRRELLAGTMSEIHSELLVGITSETSRVHP